MNNLEEGAFTTYENGDTFPFPAEAFLSLSFRNKIGMGFEFIPIPAPTIPVSKNIQCILLNTSWE